MAAYGIWIAKAAGLDASLLSILEKDNSYLYGVSRDFWASYEKLDIVCFYENKSAEYGPWKQRVSSYSDYSPFYRLTGYRSWISSRPAFRERE